MKRTDPAVFVGLAAFAIAGSAHGHVVFTQPTAVAGSHWAGALRVGHGCDGFATTSVRVEIPPSIAVVRARVPAGWTVVVERQALAEPLPAEGGGLLTERVSAITWKGRLPDDQFEEFGLAGKLPATAGTLIFPITQTCEQGVLHWKDAVVPNQPRPAHPAAALKVEAGAHDH